MALIVSSSGQHVYYETDTCTFTTKKPDDIKHYALFRYPAKKTVVDTETIAFKTSIVPAIRYNKQNSFFLVSDRLVNANLVVNLSVNGQCVFHTSDNIFCKKNSDFERYSVFAGYLIESDREEKTLIFTACYIISTHNKMFFSQLKRVIFNQLKFMFLVALIKISSAFRWLRHSIR